MKAEQRKELETNTLADKMGLVVQRVKGSPRRTFMTYLIVTVVTLAVLWLGWRWWTSKDLERSEQWLRFYDGAGHHIDTLAKEKDSYASKAARFQDAWMAYWDLGIKMLATEKGSAIASLKLSAKLYGDLAEECKDDPVFEPQALLGRAAAVESLSVLEPDLLKKAQDLYKELTSIEKYDKHAEVKFARERLKIMDDETSRKELSNTYRLLQGLLDIRDPAAQPNIQDFPFGKKK